MHGTSLPTDRSPAPISHGTSTYYSVLSSRPRIKHNATSLSAADCEAAPLFINGECTEVCSPTHTAKRDCCWLTVNRKIVDVGEPHQTEQESSFALYIFRYIINIFHTYLNSRVNASKSVSLYCWRSHGIPVLYILYICTPYQARLKWCSLSQLIIQK